MTQTTPSVGRPRSFDKDTVLDRLIPVFFAQGYVATNFSQLEAASGLHRQSLRYAFGGKRDLYMAALRRYGARKVAQIQALLQANRPALERLRAVCDMWLDDATRETSRGCLLVSTAADRGLSRDKDLQAVVRQTNARIVTLLAGTLAEARAEGAIRSRQSDMELARALLTLADGMMAHCTRCDARAEMAPVLTTFLEQMAA